MPKNDIGGLKAIGNAIKAKGLQKLRWYCQMCQKQCRDENGFKCHAMSESHQRQMLVFAENPDSVMNEFNEEFEECFLLLLSRRHSVKRVRANEVYNEYISDKDHVHMNSTSWHKLSDFVQVRGRRRDGGEMEERRRRGGEDQKDQDPPSRCVPARVQFLVSCCRSLVRLSNRTTYTPTRLLFVCSTWGARAGASWTRRRRGGTSSGSTATRPPSRARSS